MSRNEQDPSPGHLPRPTIRPAAVHVAEAKQFDYELTSQCAWKQTKSVNDDDRIVTLANTLSDQTSGVAFNSGPYDHDLRLAGVFKRTYVVSETHGDPRGQVKTIKRYQR